MTAYVPGQPYTPGMPVVTDEAAIDLLRIMAFATFAGGENLNGFVVPQPPPGKAWKVDPDLLDLVACNPPGEKQP